MKKYLLLSSVTIAVFSFLLFGCTKIDKTTLGTNLIPVIDNINTFDTIMEVTTSNNILVDTTTRIFKTENHVFGYLKDNLFGNTEARIYFQVTAPFLNYRFPVGKDSMQSDSIVLILSYKGAYGDTLAPLTASVHEINETYAGFRPDSIYRLNKTFNVLPSPLGTKSFTAAELPKLIYHGKDSSTNELRIKLDFSFAERFRNIDTAYFKNDSTFTNFLRGLAIIPNYNGSSVGALTYFDLIGAGTRLKYYYRYNNRTGGKDTTFTEFRFNQFNSNANYVARDRSIGEISMHPNGVADSLLYIQATPGTYARVKINGLSGFGNRIIHNASLYMQQIYAGPALTEKSLAAPFYLTTDLIDNTTGQPNTGYDSLIYSSLYTGIYGNSYFGYVGGFRLFTRDNNNDSVARYEVNITRYVQAIVTRNIPNNPLRIYAPYRFVPHFSSPISVNPLAYGRVRLGGGNHSKYRMKLRIVYSKF